MRLTALLDLTPQQVEDTLCRFVVVGMVWGRIDRPAGIVNFLVEKTWMGVNAAQAALAKVKACGLEVHRCWLPISRLCPHRWRDG